mgnify:CR=1 FL=1
MTGKGKEKRKMVQLAAEEEMAKGNIAIIKVLHDKERLESLEKKKTSLFSICSSSFVSIHFVSPASRNAYQSITHHGEIGVGPVRAVQSGDRPRRAGGRNQQETLAGNHQRPPPAIKHHFRCVYSAHPVSRS